MKNKKLILILIYASFVFAVFIVCVCVGSVFVGFKEVLNILLSHVFSKPSGSSFDAIIWTLRTPRVLLCALVGASLSIAGAAMQGVVRNPLADGSTLGITSGASLGAVCFIAVGGSTLINSRLALSFVSVTACMLSFLIILWFAKKIDSNFSSNTIILTGIIFTMLVSSASSFVLAFSGDALKSIVFWSMGSFSGRGWESVFWMSLFALVGITGLLWHSLELDAFSFGETQARYSGVNVGRSRFLILFFISVLCGACVSVSGNIAFVGLVLPHIIRIIFGASHRTLLPLSALFGAVFLMLCDLFSRTILSPVELPIGIITSIIGSIVFGVIFYKQNK